jgi:hypothetical protein
MEMEMETGVLGYNWATLSLRDMSTEICPSRLRVVRKADDLAPYKNYYCEIQKSGNRMFYFPGIEKSDNLPRKAMAQKGLFFQ